jgi:hypothetical protein
VEDCAHHPNAWRSVKSARGTGGVLGSISKQADFSAEMADLTLGYGLLLLRRRSPLTEKCDPDSY